MTVRDWIARRTPPAPPVLTQSVLAALGPDADDSETRASEVCLAAAARALQELLAGKRFGRDSALELLTVDALTTYAYEHASASAHGPDLPGLARRGATAIGQLTTQRV